MDNYSFYMSLFSLRDPTYPLRIYEDMKHKKSFIFIKILFTERWEEQVLEEVKDDRENIVGDIGMNTLMMRCIVYFQAVIIKLHCTKQFANDPGY